MRRPTLALACALALSLLWPLAPAVAQEADETDPDAPVSEEPVEEEPEPAEPHPIVFPVVGDVHWTDTWQAPRSGGRRHEGQDLMGTKGQPLVAADDGVITVARSGSLAGHFVELLADDGWIYSYLHLNNDTPGTDDGQATPDQIFGPGIEQGTRVVAGQVVGYLGDSGNAEGTSPHLHFEMRDPSGTKVNPQIHLEHAERVDGSAGAEPSPIPRIAGRDRVATAVEAALEGWPRGADDAVLAAGDVYAEALPAGVLAGAQEAPLLLTIGDDLETEVGEALDDLDVEVVTVVGSVPASVDAELDDLGFDVRRIGVVGDPATTAAELAEEIGGGSGTVVLVNSSRFADGVSAAGLAAGRGWPVLLTTTSVIPQVTVDAIRSLGADDVVLVGGTGVIGENIEAFLEASGCEGKTPCDVERLAGRDRYATAVAAAERSLQLGDRSAADVFVGTGTAYPDALTAGPLAAQRHGLAVLVDGTGGGHDAATRDFLEELRPAIKRVSILGGTGAVSAAADRALQAVLGLD